MVSKVGSLAKPASQIWISEAMAKQLNLNKLSDTARPKDGDVGRSQKPTFESIFVYKCFREWVRYPYEGIPISTHEFESWKFGKAGASDLGQ